VRGYLGISAHWHLFMYFFMFACLKDGSKAVTISCTNLRTKQGRGDKYLPSSLTSPNCSWHKRWFYLRNIEPQRHRRCREVAWPSLVNPPPLA
jgi:hypothetical protein